jgi:hypothetical protein
MDSILGFSIYKRHKYTFFSLTSQAQTTSTRLPFILLSSLIYTWISYKIYEYRSSIMFEGDLMRLVFVARSLSNHKYAII